MLTIEQHAAGQREDTRGSVTFSDKITGIHPFADKFPMLAPAEHAELVESIRSNGLRNPVVLTKDGLILDGRNRHAACLEAGVEPTTATYDGDDFAEYVIDCNVTRRNMSTGARAMSTALVLAADGRRNGGRWRRGSLGAINEDSRLSQAWKKALEQSGVIIDFAPDLAEQVVSGSLALDAAFRQAEQARDAERLKLEREERIAAEEADAKAFVTEMSPDLAAQVGGPFQSFAEAKAVWEKRNREEAARLAKEKAETAKAEADLRKAYTDLYTGIAENIQGLAVYGDHADVPGLFENYSTRHLNPPQFASQFEVANLRNAIRFLEKLIDWKSND